MSGFNGDWTYVFLPSGIGYGSDLPGQWDSFVGGSPLFYHEGTLMTQMSYWQWGAGCRVLYDALSTGRDLKDVEGQVYYFSRDDEVIFPPDKEPTDVLIIGVSPVIPHCLLRDYAAGLDKITR